MPLAPPQFELTGVPVLTAGGNVLFMLSTPPVGMTEPALLAGPDGIGRAVVPGYEAAGAMVAGGLFQACGELLEPVAAVAPLVVVGADWFAVVSGVV